MVLLRGHQLAAHNARQMVDRSLGEHIERRLAVTGNEVHAHHGLVSGAKGIDHKGRARIKRIRLERHFGVIVRLYEQNALADSVKPIRNLVIRIGFPGAVQELVQLFQLGLYALAPCRVRTGLLKQIAVLEINHLGGGIDLNDVQNVLADVLVSVEDGLNAPCVPVQKLLLEHILDVVDKRRVQFLYKFLLRDLIKRRVDVEPPKHIVPNHRRLAKFVVQTLTLSQNKKRPLPLRSSPVWLYPQPVCCEENILLVS